MNCEIIQDLIPLYCEGLCSDETRAAVEEHAAHCDNCKKLLAAAGTEPEVPAPETYDEEEARVLQGVKKRYSRIRWRAVLITVAAAAAVMAMILAVVWHDLSPYPPASPRYDVTLVYHDSMADARYEKDEYHADWIGFAWAGDEITDKKVRELALWNHIVDLELHYVYVAPYDVRASGEVKNGRTTLRYEGYVTTRDGETIEYRNEMTFDGAFGPEGELFDG